MAPRVSSSKLNALTPPRAPPPSHPAKGPGKQPSAKGAGDEFSTRKVPTIPQPPLPAVPPSGVTAEARNSWTLEFKPPITDEATARQAIFGSDKVADGLVLQQKKDLMGQPMGGWTITVVTDEKKTAPNNIPWEKYQAGVRPELQAYLSKHLPANLKVPDPGAQAAVLPEHFAEEKAVAAEKAKKFTVTGWSEGMVIADTLGGVKNIDVTSYDVSFKKPMSREEVQKFFWEQKGTPMNSGLEPVPANAKLPTADWRVSQPRHHTTDHRAKGIDVFLATKMAEQLKPENYRRPEWIPARTAEAMRTKALPPAGLEVKHPKPGIAVWREGNGVFWYDQKSGNVQGFPRQAGDGEGTKMWNNWNTAYIEQGISPKEAAPKVVQDMADTNRQMLMAFATALGKAQTPGRGVKGALEMTNEVFSVIDDKGDLIEETYKQSYPDKKK